MRRSPRPNRTALRLEKLEDRQLMTAGLLDPTFGGDGFVLTNVSAADYYEEIYGVAVYPTSDGSDGKIVAAGVATPRVKSLTFDNDFAIVRYNPDGSLDPTFSGDGKVTTDFGSTSDVAVDVALVAGNKVVAGGYANGDFALARYNSDGSLDPTFGTNGKVQANFARSNYDFGLSMKVQSDGKILMAGTTQASKAGSPRNVGLMRFNANGTLDTSFASGGELIVPGAEAGTTLIGNVNLALFPDTSAQAGKFLLMASLKTSVVVYRFMPNGQLDASFGAGGAQTLSVFPRSLAIDASDRLVLGHTVSFTPPGEVDQQELAVTRLNADGTMDNSFGIGGTTIINLPSTSARYSNEWAEAIGLDPAGRILIGGAQLVNDGISFRQRSFIVARMLADGQLDTSYGTGGIGTSAADPTPIRTHRHLGFAVAPNGKAIIGGTTDASTNENVEWNMAIARFDGDPPASSSTSAYDAAIASWLAEIAASDLQSDSELSSQIL